MLLILLLILYAFITLVNQEFGLNKKLLTIYKEFSEGKNRYDKKHVDKTKIKRIELLKQFEKECPNERISIKEQMDYENELLGYIQVTISGIDKRYVYITDLNTKFAPRIELYCLANGKTDSFKVQKKLFEKNPIKKGDIIYIEQCQKKNQSKFENGTFVQVPDQFDWWLNGYKILSEEEINKL